MSAGKEMELISVELVFVYIPFFFFRNVFILSWLVASSIVITVSM